MKYWNNGFYDEPIEVGRNNRRVLQSVTSWSISRIAYSGKQERLSDLSCTSTLYQGN
jgi:hypothetical protein